MSRIRIYNASKEYYFCNAKQKSIFRFHPKSIKSTRYATRRTADKEYFSARLVLPSKFFGFEVVGKKYLLIKLHRTHITYGKKDLWGYAYLLFFNMASSNLNIIRLDCDKQTCRKNRKKYSIVSKHTRKSNNKVYTSGKIYLNKEVIGKSIFLIEIIPKIKITYNQKKKDILFDTNEPVEVSDLGKGYMIFYEDVDAKEIKTSFKTVRDIASYKKTISLINQKKGVKYISKKRKIKPTSVWNHICLAYKKGIIQQNTLKEIIMQNCHKHVSDEIVVFIEIMRNKQYSELQRMRIPFKKFDKPAYLNFTRKELKERIYEKTGKKLPLNMIEAIALFLNSLYKK